MISGAERTGEASRFVRNAKREKKRRGQDAVSACTREPIAAGMLPFGSDPVWLVPPQLETASCPRRAKMYGQVIEMSNAWAVLFLESSHSL